MSALLLAMGIILAVTGVAIAKADLPSSFLATVMVCFSGVAAFAFLVLSAEVCRQTISWANHGTSSGWFQILPGGRTRLVKEMVWTMMGAIGHWCRTKERWIALGLFTAAVVLIFVGSLWPRYVEVKHVPSQGQEVASEPVRHRQVGLLWHDVAVAMGGLIMGLVVTRSLGLPNSTTAVVWRYFGLGVIAVGLGVLGLLVNYGLIPWAIDPDGLVKLSLVFVTVGVALLGATIPKLLP